MTMDYDGDTDMSPKGEMDYETAGPMVSDDANPVAGLVCPPGVVARSSHMHPTVMAARKKLNFYDDADEMD